MEELISLIGRHGYLLVFVIVLAESLGLPVPAALALVAGGAAAASGVLSLSRFVVLAVLGMIIGDSLLFVLGRYKGWALLCVVCQASCRPVYCTLHLPVSY